MFAKMFATILSVALVAVPLGVSAQSVNRVTGYPEDAIYIVFRSDLGEVDLVTYYPTGQSVPFKNPEDPLTQQMYFWMQANGVIDLSKAPAGYDYVPAFYKNATP